MVRFISKRTWYKAEKKAGCVALSRPTPLHRLKTCATKSSGLFLKRWLADSASPTPGQDLSR